MSKMDGILKSKGFYIALGTGLAAFGSLMVAYNYRSSLEETDNKPAIDLNEAYVMDTQENITQEKINITTEDAVKANITVNNKKEETKSEKKEEPKNTTENVTEDEYICEEVVADAKSNIEDRIASLEYNGEKLLATPITGEVILPYSMDTTVYFKTLKQYRCNQGMLIQAEEGADVISAYAGIVTAIDDTKEFGTVVTVNMGNGYEAYYGQMMNVCVGVGDAVSVGQVIGEIAPVTAYYTEEGNHLYFKVTKDGIPVDPQTLFKDAE